MLLDLLQSLLIYEIDSLRPQIEPVFRKLNITYTYVQTMVATFMTLRARAAKHVSPSVSMYKNPGYATEED